MLQAKANKKRDLHNELLYSPNLPFYKNDPYYKHFVDAAAQQQTFIKK
jgi:hypothetical protein